MNERAVVPPRGFIAKSVGSDWWTVGSHHPHESQGCVRIGGPNDPMRIMRRGWMGYKRQAGRAPSVIPPQAWNVKPLNLPRCPQDANDAE